MILRERDANTSWTAASDGTLEERRYYCQNWRADVSVILASGGTLVEWVKYSPYGIPFGLPGADTDSDGDCDATDISNFDSVPSYDVRYDIDLDGDNDATDKAIAQTYYQGTTYGWDILSSNPDTGTGNRKGYAGYEYHEAVSLYHIRNRVLHPELGRWTRRDPLGYVDGMNVYEYVRGRAIRAFDILGLSSSEGSCEDFLGTIYDDPELEWILHKVSSECTKAKIRVEMKCCSEEQFEGLCYNGGQAGHGPCGSTRGIGIEDSNDPYIILCLCVDKDGNPITSSSGKTCDFKDDIQHELIHAWQICAAKRGKYTWRCSNRRSARNWKHLCFEIGAYSNAPNSDITTFKDCPKLCKRYANFGFPDETTCVKNCMEAWPMCSEFAPGGWWDDPPRNCSK